MTICPDCKSVMEVHRHPWNTAVAYLGCTQCDTVRRCGINCITGDIFDVGSPESQSYSEFLKELNKPWPAGE